MMSFDRQETDGVETRCADPERWSAPCRCLCILGRYISSARADIRLDARTVKVSVLGVFLLKCSGSIWRSYKNRNVFKITTMCIGLRCSSPLPNRIVQSAGRPVRSSKVQYSFDFVSVSLHSELAAMISPVTTSRRRNQPQVRRYSTPHRPKLHSGTVPSPTYCTCIRLDRRNLRSAVSNRGIRRIVGRNQCRPSKLQP
jgi:hypothetical protein